MKPALFALLLAAASAAQAQTVYRCGSEYSQKPCPDARAVTPEVHQPTAAEAKKAKTQAQRNAKLADQMEKERLAQEKKVAGPQMVVTGQKPQAPASAASQAKKDAKKKKKEPANFTATAPKK